MHRLSVRRSGSFGGDLAGALVGLGLGFVAGFAAAGLLGDVRRERVSQAVQGLRRRPPPGSGAATDLVRRALAGDPQLAGLELIVRPVRGGWVELHGWVPSRSLGARAVRLAARAAPGLEVTSRLRVRGEDDPPARPADHRRPA
jgi:hypothetical protein